VLVGAAASDVYHVLELKAVIRKNILYSQQPVEECAQPQGFASFSLSESPAGVLQWLKRTYSFVGELNTAGAFAAGFVYVRDRSSLLITAGALSERC
jgi:hypothetical protein